MNESTKHRQLLTLRSLPADADKLANFLSNFVKSFEIADEIHNDLRLAAEETFINIVSYAYEQLPQAVSIELNKQADSISITFIDSGIAFNPLTDADECKDSDDHCEGGMGIHLITALTDQQEYRRVEQTNVFTLTKHYTKKQ